MLLHTEEYSEQIDNFMERHEVKPGITGCAQVNGYRGQIKDLEDMKGVILVLMFISTFRVSAHLALKAPCYFK